MVKKIVIFLIVLILGVSFIGVRKVSMERTRKRGLMEVNTILYQGPKNRKEILEEAMNLRSQGKFSQARRVIEDNIENARDDLRLEGFLDELDDHTKRLLKNYSVKACLEDMQIKQYYNRIYEDNMENIYIDSNTNNFIFVDIQEQRTNIYKMVDDKWILEKKFICSTGQEDTPTPVGVFTLLVRDEWFYNPKFERGAKYYIAFKGDKYLFHSEPYYSDKKTIWEERLGVPMSHGCIRHSTENQKWIYDNIPDGTKVIIY